MQDDANIQEEATSNGVGEKVQAPALGLPKGGGAIRGMGEKFTANPVTGTRSMTVPIATSPGRSGFGPQLSLSYDSGAGNGPFGFGWNLSLPSITRKTDKGLPRYLDAIESDEFILSGAEDLVPVYQQDDQGEWLYDDDGNLLIQETPVDGYRVRRYRPRIEGLFARIERWSKIGSPKDVHWRSMSKDNVLTIYGLDENSRIADPNKPERIFSWLICESRDDKGNGIVYRYKNEDGTHGSNQPSPFLKSHQANRGDASDPRRTAQRYLHRVLYGNRTPLLLANGQRPRTLSALPEPPKDDPQENEKPDWLFEVRLDYGELDEKEPTNKVKLQPWLYRPDAFSSYRAGFEVRTCRRCERVLMLHHIPIEPGQDKDVGVVRSTEFTYDDELDPNLATAPVYSFLKKVTQTGWDQTKGSTKRQGLPPLELDYTKPIVQDYVEDVDPESLENLPVGLDGSSFRWVDLHGEGVPGVLAEQAGAWLYKRNLSAVSVELEGDGTAATAKFAALETVCCKPNVSLRSGAEFMDLAGDGLLDIVVMDSPTPGLYEHDEAEGWQPFRPFTSKLNRSLRNSNLKFIDLDGDGHADVLISEDDAFVWHASLAEAGFGPAQRVANELDEEKGPRIVFADGTESIYLADLSGDGLTDIVRIRNGETCYWPNLGHCQFGTKITMDNAPWFDSPDQFSQKRIRLADIDGSGTTDIIYLHRDGVRLYFNQSGNSWSQPSFLKAFPRIDDLTSVMTVDLLGNGTACLVWSSPLPGDAGRQMSYINLMGSWPSISPVDIRDLPSLISKLKDPQRPFDHWLRSKLSSEALRALQSHNGPTDDLSKLYTCLAKDLNEVIAGKRTYAREALADIQLRSSTKDLLAKEASGDSSYRVLNRLLLEDAYSSELARNRTAKPHLMIRASNNLGADTEVHYATSTKFYLLDKAAGRPWIKRLPFPVHVVERVTTCDHISGNRFSTRYAYHHGYFDGEEREFRGFGMVEQWDTENFASFEDNHRFAYDRPVLNEDIPTHVPPVHTKTWFHTGAYLNRQHVSRQYENEYYRSPGLTVDEARPLLLEDTVLPSGLDPKYPRLSSDEEREACRALKGLMLRQEVYADDAEHPDATPEQVARASRPYTVTEQNFSIRMLQPRGANPHAVFFTHAREALSYHFERNLEDPRVQHALTLEVDDFGNVLKQVSIGYGRHVSPLFEKWDRDQQTVPLTTYTQSRVTNSVSSSDTYRAPLPCEAITFELTEYTATGSTGRFQLSDFVEPVPEEDEEEPGRLRHKFNGPDLPYAARASGSLRRRPIEWVRTLYRRDSLGPPDNPSDSEDKNDLLPLGDLESLAIPGESYQLAFTSDVLAPFAQRLAQANPAETLTEVLGGQRGDQGGYVSGKTLKANHRFPKNDKDEHWWIPSGRSYSSKDLDHGASAELDEARRHFFLPRRYTDPFGQNATVDFDDHDLLMTETRDARGNRVAVEVNDYRVLQPRMITDANGNRTEVAFDALGLVVATAVMGKAAEGLGDRLEGLDPGLKLDANPELEVLKQFVADPQASASSLLGKATTRIVYDLDRFARTGQPPFAATLSRETHWEDPDGDKSKIQIAFSYSDGFGREIQKKVQAELGEAPERGPMVDLGNGDVRSGDLKRDSDGNLVTATVDRRWVGTGRTVFNNKGNPIRQYEPFFSATHLYEPERVMTDTGVSPVLFYDPLERVVATLHPNNTYEKVVFDAWQQTSYDVNDTSAPHGEETGDPRSDPDVGTYVANYFETQPDGWKTWAQLRATGARGPHEKAAAERAAAHADTPTTVHLDTLGRPFLTIARNRVVCKEHPDHDEDKVEEICTRIELDIEGNQRAVRDGDKRVVVDGNLVEGDQLGRIVMRYDYDMLGNRIHQSSMEAGARWVLNDVAGNPIRAWDSRGHAFKTEYDALRRPTARYVRSAPDTDPDADESDPRTEVDGWVCIEKIEYGEGQQYDQKLNLRTRVFRHRDSAGEVINGGVDANGQRDAYDFKGNLLRSSRRLVKDYTAIPDWNAAVELETETFESVTRYDALNRPIQSIAPYSSLGDGNRSILQPRYNEANLLDGVDVWLDQNAEPPGRFFKDGANWKIRDATGQVQNAPSPKPGLGVTGIDYNAKGQRLQIAYKNGAVTRYAYDENTFRLTRLYTRRGKSFTGDCANINGSPPTVDAPKEFPEVGQHCGLQNLSYTYDPAGNITHIRDDAQQTIFFRNRWVEPSNDYTYDALYRLIEAHGREHLGQKIHYSDSDAERMNQPLPQAQDAQAMGRYVERYRYDVAGNITEMRHRVNEPQSPQRSWRRNYHYEEDSMLENAANGSVLKKSNRLSHSVVNEKKNGTTTHHKRETYRHDAHGNMTRMPHLYLVDRNAPAPNMHWDYADRLRKVDLVAGGTAYYVYDASGQRVRKVLQKDSSAAICERTYLGGVEVYREREGTIGDVSDLTNPNTPDLERETLHVMDDTQRIAMVETRTKGTDDYERRTIRYQFGNHLGSASLELNEQAQVISYEEYAPYGPTTYQAVDSDLKAVAKRYRYSGKERDEECQLYYFGFRYYSHVACRWTSSDPSGVTDSQNLYIFTHCSPAVFRDKQGLQGSRAIDLEETLRSNAQKQRQKASDKIELAEKFLETKEMLDKRIVLDNPFFNEASYLENINLGRVRDALLGNEYSLLEGSQQSARADLSKVFSPYVMGAAKLGAMSNAREKELEISGPEAGPWEVISHWIEYGIEEYGEKVFHGGVTGAPEALPDTWWSVEEKVESAKTFFDYLSSDVSLDPPDVEKISLPKERRKEFRTILEIEWAVTIYQIAAELQLSRKAQTDPFGIQAYFSEKRLAKLLEKTNDITARQIALFKATQVSVYKAGVVTP